MKTCEGCRAARAVMKRPRTQQMLCRECFYACVEAEVHTTIVQNRLFKPGERIAVGASGGKDSTVLIHLLHTLNQRHNYGVELLLLSVDEGIVGYRDDSLKTVEQNQETYGLPLTIVSYADLYGCTMDQVVAKIGKKHNCTYCGVFRRQALDRGARNLGATKIATGHNADDIAETVLLNLLRGDHFRLGKCTEIVTGEEGDLPRCKPLKYLYEKEIVLYAHFKQLIYFSTECIYSPEAYRGYAREFLKDLERVQPSSIIDLIHSGEVLTVEGKMPVKRTCERCGAISSQAVCKACTLLETLNAM